MINFLIALLLTLSTGGDACKLGTDVDWYAWADAHPSASTVVTLELSQDIWIYQDGDAYLMFVFREDIRDVLASGRNNPHGRCAVLIEVTPDG